MSSKDEVSKQDQNKGSTLDESKYPELKYWLNEEKSDVIFKVEDKPLPALKAILMVKSPVFDAMFSNGFKESVEKEIPIEGTTYRAFKAFLQFIYLEDLLSEKDFDVKDYQLVREVCKLADRYAVLRLLDVIGTKLNNDLEDNLEILDQIASIAFDFKIDHLLKSIEGLVKKKFKQLVRLDVKKLKTINEKTNGLFLELIVQSYRNGDRFYDPVGTPITSKRFTRLS